MKKIFAISLFLSFPFWGYSQGEMDAYKFSTNELTGTARSMAMGGAFGALGGDISTLSSNPGGIAVYRSSELVFTPSLMINNTTVTNPGSKMDENRTRMTIPNFGFVASFHTGYSKGLLNFNIGFAQNRIASFNRTTLSRNPAQATSISDYFAYKTNSTNNWSGANYNDLLSDNAYDYMNWASTLAAGANLITEDGNVNDFYCSTLPLGTVDSRLNIRETGWIDEYAISMGGNINNILYAGLTVGIQDMNHTSNSLYIENFSTGSLALSNLVETTGTGWNVKLGLIARPFSFMRIGVAYHTPTYFKLSDYSYGDAESNINRQYYSDKTPSAVYDYEFRTPSKFLASYALIIAQQAILSLDYEYADYSAMKFNSKDYLTIYDETNEYISSDYKGAHTIRIGAEVKLDPSFSIRGGWATTTSSVSSNVNDEMVEIPTAGTMPHYSFDDGKDYYSFGLGYRYKEFFIDLAYVLKVQKEKLYSFSPYFAYPDSPEYYDMELEVPPYGLTFNEDEVGSNLNNNVASKVKNNFHQILLTLGFKF